MTEFTPEEYDALAKAFDAWVKLESLKAKTSRATKEWFDAFQAVGDINGPLWREHRRQREDYLSGRDYAYVDVDWEEVAVQLSMNEFHRLEYYWEGDGWNEPLSDHWSCSCEDNENPREDVFYISWVQTDPKCLNRPSFGQVCKEWLEHVEKERSADF